MLIWFQIYQVALKRHSWYFENISESLSDKKLFNKLLIIRYEHNYLSEMKKFNFF